MSIVGMILVIAIPLAFVIATQLGRVKVDKARQLVKDGALLLDVRSPEEFRSGALPGALNIPVHDLAKRVGELTPSRPTIVYCASGTRSRVAASILKTRGFAEVHDLGPQRRWSKT